MQIHKLKTWPEYFNRVVTDEKTFEIRKNDRGFQEGDILILEEWKPQGFSLTSPNERTGIYTGREVSVKVIYVLPQPLGDNMGIMNGYVVMSITRHYENT